MPLTASSTWPVRGSVFLLIGWLAAVIACFPTSQGDVPSTNTTEIFYDYVVVGCGIAGLVVATRLSEDPDTTVACIEAGSLDNYDDLIQIPVHIGQQPPGYYESNLMTVAQPQLDNRTRQIPLGKGVGGGSLINGMVWNRGSRDDFNSWEQLGNPAWSWDHLLPYFRKSETYTPRYYPGAREQPVTYDRSAHGFGGPVQVSYPSYFWPQSQNWFDAMRWLNIETCFDPNDGLSAGAYFLPACIDPVNQTRSDARRAYHDPASWRPNYQVIPNSQVARIIFDSASSVPLGPATPVDDALAIGVEVLGDTNDTNWAIYASREVILAAGAIRTPQLLELSGIGEATLLNSLEIPLVQDLPGVDQNTSLPNPSSLATNASFNSTAATQYFANRTGPWTAKPSNALAFPSLRQVLPSDAFNILRNETVSNPHRSYPRTYDATLQAGYEFQRRLRIDQVFAGAPAYEILNDNSGGLDLALMRPLSRGTTHITSGDPRADPGFDPRWLIDPLDHTILLQAMQFNQKILDTPAIQELQPSYGQIPYNASLDQLDTVLRQGLSTEFHYCGTAAMLERGLGGVVDPNLLVYGTKNLRVVDTSIFPIIPGGHLQAVAYAVAEKAADIIKAADVGE